MAGRWRWETSVLNFQAACFLGSPAVSTEHRRCHRYQGGVKSHLHIFKWRMNNLQKAWIRKIWETFRSHAELQASTKRENAQKTHFTASWLKQMRHCVLYVSDGPLWPFGSFTSIHSLEPSINCRHIKMPRTTLWKGMNSLVKRQGNKKHTQDKCHFQMKRTLFTRPAFSHLAANLHLPLFSPFPRFYSLVNFIWKSILPLIRGWCSKSV